MTYQFKVYVISHITGAQDGSVSLIKRAEGVPGTLTFCCLRACDDFSSVLWASRF